MRMYTKQGICIVELFVGRPFDGEDEGDRLDPSDATYVDVMHTSAGHFGEETIGSNIQVMCDLQKNYHIRNVIHGIYIYNIACLRITMTFL